MNGLAPSIQPTLARLTSADNRTRLTGLMNSELLARGCVVIIGIDAIRDRLAEQWGVKREMVWEAVARMLDRKLTPPAQWARASEVDFVLCAADDPETSRVLALKILRDLLEFFLGVQRFEDMRIATVLSISEDFELACARLDPRALSQEHTGAGSPASGSDWSTLSFAVPEGGAVELEFHRERVINLRNGTAIANRIWTRLRNQETGLYLSDRWPEQLSPSCLGLVNDATADRAKTLYATTKLGVFLSASIHTVANTRNRADIIRHLEQVRKDPLRPIILELLDIEAGTPQGRIEEVVGMMTPHCRKILARAQPDRVPVDLLRGCRLTGLTIDCGLMRLPTRDLFVQLSRFAEAARRVSPLVFALRLDNEVPSELALAAGITHCGCNTSLH